MAVELARDAVTIRRSASSARARWATGSRRCSRSPDSRCDCTTSAPAALDRARATIEKSLAKFVEKGKLTAADRDAALGRLPPAPSIDDLGDVDYVVEAIVENARRQARRSSRSSTRSRGPDVILTLEHVVDFDHRARRGDEAARPRARHALHEPGAADDARRAGARPGDVGRVDADRRSSCARRSARRRSRRPTTPASSPTAS